MGFDWILECVSTTCSQSCLGGNSPTKVSKIMEEFAEKCSNLLRLREANRRAGHSRSRSRTPKKDQPQEGKGGEKTAVDGDNEKRENRNEAGL